MTPNEIAGLRAGIIWFWVVPFIFLSIEWLMHKTQLPRAMTDILTSVLFSVLCAPLITGALWMIGRDYDSGGAWVAQYQPSMLITLATMLASIVAGVVIAARSPAGGTLSAFMAGRRFYNPLQRQTTSTRTVDLKSEIEEILREGSA